MNPAPLEPRTREEWQHVADIAGGALVLRDARRYGLVVGGPIVNAARCEEILKRAAEIGVKPGGNIDRFISLVLADGSQALETDLSKLEQNTVETKQDGTQPIADRPISCPNCKEVFSLADYPPGRYEFACPECNEKVTGTV